MRKILICLLSAVMAVSAFAELKKIERLKPLAARVGIVGVGHHTYWGQFDGLLDVMKQKLNEFT